MSQSPSEAGPEGFSRSDSRLDVFEREQRSADPVLEPDRAAFLSAMRDESRLPMNILVGMGWLLQHSGLNPTQQHYLHELQTAGAHLLRIVERLLDDGRALPDADRQLRSVPVSVVGVGAAAVAVGSLLPGERKRAAVPWDDARWRSLCLKLCTLLDEADTTCLRLAREHEDWLRLRFGSTYEAWTRALSEFDFELALHLLQAVEPGLAQP